MATVPSPTWEPLSLRCGCCDHAWRDWQPLNVPIETWAAHMSGLACPFCGVGRNTLLGKALAGTIVEKMLSTMRVDVADG